MGKTIASIISNFERKGANRSLRMRINKLQQFSMDKPERVRHGSLLSAASYPSSGRPVLVQQAIDGNLEAHATAINCANI